MDMKYGCDDDNECAEQFLQLLEKAYWVAAIWDIDTPNAFDFGKQSKRALAAKADETAAAPSTAASLVSVAGAGAALAAVVGAAAVFVRRQLSRTVVSSSVVEA